MDAVYVLFKREKIVKRNLRKCNHFLSFSISMSRIQHKVCDEPKVSKPYFLLFFQNERELAQEARFGR